MPRGELDGTHFTNASFDTQSLVLLGLSLSGMTNGSSPERICLLDMVHKNSNGCYREKGAIEIKMGPKKIVDSCSIVLIGSFNPQIFQPYWFAHHELIQMEEAEKANLEVIAKDITSFKLGWLTVQVFREKFSAVTDDESHFAPLRDFVLGTFQLLEHTPVNQMGINRNIQYEVASEEDWHKIGHTLAPKRLWESHLRKPGLTSLTINGTREDGLNGGINVTVRPVFEKKILEKKHVVEVAYNSHFVFEKDSDAKDILEIIEETFEPTLDKGQVLANSLINECIEE